MAAVVALLLLVPGSLLVIALLAVAWTALFVCLHVVAEIIHPLRARIYVRVRRAETARIEAVELPLISPGTRAA